jgi:hypothetical protein
MRKMARVGDSVLAGMLVAIVVTAALLAGCATPQAGAPRVMQPGDFKMLAGSWLGSTDVQGTLSIPIQGVIQETGAFYTVPRNGGTQAPGMMKIVDGGVVYETATSKGKMTFHETDTAWVWKWDGVAADGGKVRNELTRSK